MLKILIALQISPIRQFQFWQMKQIRDRNSFSWLIMLLIYQFKLLQKMSKTWGRVQDDSFSISQTVWLILYKNLNPFSRARYAKREIHNLSDQLLTYHAMIKFSDPIVYFRSIPANFRLTIEDLLWRQWTMEWKNLWIQWKTKIVKPFLFFPVIMALFKSLTILIRSGLSERSRRSPET